MRDSYQLVGYRDPDSFDFRGAIRSIVEATAEYRLLVLISCIASLLIATAYVLLFPPVYIVTARVMVEKPVDNSRDAFYSLWDAFRKDDPRTEIELITAPNVIAEVVQKEGLKFDDVYHPFLSELSYLFTSSAPGKFFREIKGYLFPRPIDPDAPSAADIALAKTITDLSAGVRMLPVADSDVGELTVKGPSRRVAKVANTLLETYMALRQARYRMEAQRDVDALDKEVDFASQRMHEIAQRRLTFTQSNGLTFDLAKETQELTKLVEAEDSLAANRSKAASLEASLLLVEQQISQEPPTKTSSVVQEINAVREASKLKRLDLQEHLIAIQSVYRDDSPEVREVRDSIAALDALIANQPEQVEKASTTTLNSRRQDLLLSADSLRSQLVGINAGVSVMERRLFGLRTRMDAVPELQNKIRDFDRQYSLASDEYQALSAKRAQAAVSLAMTGSAMPSMQVVQWASSPDEPASPKLKLLYPSALSVGLIIGVLGAQIRRLTSGRVHRRDLEGPLLDSPFYATISIPIGGQLFSVVDRRRAAAFQR